MTPTPRPGWFSRLRLAAPPLDHLVRAFVRYIADSSDRLAAAITYYGFLMVFPLLVLAASVVGYVVRGNPVREQRLLANIGSYVPGELAGTLVHIISNNAGKTGVIGLVGLAFAGLGWVDTLRESIRSVWHQEPVTGSILKKKVKDLGILGGLGATVVASLAVTSLGTSYARTGLDLLGLNPGNPAAHVLLSLVALLLAVVTDVALLAYIFLWLPRVAEPLRRVLRGTVFGAVGLELLKFGGIYYLNQFTSAGSRLYGAALAAGFGVLIWINLVSRFVLYAAAWTVTAPYDTDVKPSGSSTDAEPNEAAGRHELATGRSADHESPAEIG